MAEPGRKQSATVLMPLAEAKGRGAIAYPVLVKAAFGLNIGNDSTCLCVRPAGFEKPCEGLLGQWQCAGERSRIWDWSRWDRRIKLLGFLESGLQGRRRGVQGFGDSCASSIGPQQIGMLLDKLGGLRDTGQ